MINFAILHKRISRIVKIIEVQEAIRYRNAKPNKVVFDLHRWLISKRWYLIFSSVIYFQLDGIPLIRTRNPVHTHNRERTPSLILTYTLVRLPSLEVWSYPVSNLTFQIINCKGSCGGCTHRPCNFRFNFRFIKKFNRVEVII